MNILFLTLANINTIHERGIYQDLLRKFTEEGIVSPTERRNGKETHLIKSKLVDILRVKTLNIQKTNIIEKGVGTIAVEYQYLNAIRKSFNSIKFDLVLYSTPPITFSKVIKFIKERDNAISYLLLKDIFPQNAVDMKMMKYGGLIHHYFRRKEKELYNISDYIGCMSVANKEYLITNNSYLAKDKIEINPNSISPINISTNKKDKTKIRKKYNLPIDKKIFVYGGNLGNPQGVDFLLETISNITEKDIFFLIIGDGTMYSIIENWFSEHKPLNAKLVKNLPKSEYDNVLKVCDVGLIFLHKDFTIPNFPSRLLSYLEMKMPIIAATDISTDIGIVIENNRCGYWVESGDVVEMKLAIIKIISNKKTFNEMKNNSFNLLLRDYTVDVSYNLINEKV